MKQLSQFDSISYIVTHVGWAMVSLKSMKNRIGVLI